MSHIEFVFDNWDLDSNNIKLETALYYLKNIKDPSKIVESEKCQQAISYIFNFAGSIFYLESKNAFKIFMENDFQYIWSDLVNYFSQICDTLTVSDFLKVLILDDTQNIVNRLLAYNIQYRLFFYENNGLKSLLKMLTNQKFLDNFNNSNLFEIMVMNINWLSKNAELYKTEWNELRSTEILLELARKYPVCKLNAYMAFVNIANDREIETFEETKFILTILIQMSNEIAEIFNSGEPLKRKKQQFIEDDEHAPIEYDVYFILPNNYTIVYSVTGIMLALYRLSINNTIKYNIYVENNLKDPLRVIIFKGNDIEKKYALQVLAQLSFDSRISELIRNDIELKNHIMTLASESDSIVKQLPKLCKQIAWVFELKSNNAPSLSNDYTRVQQKRNRIMISYNSASRDLCLKIKDVLDMAGFKVWIDVNEIHGSSLDAMAKAVESSDWVLICITEKYRQSINCQAEAQYAFKMKKCIIPLIMQNGYENVNGWLGIILGDKIFINFMKYSFQECCKRLFNELSKSSSSIDEALLTAANRDPIISIIEHETKSNKNLLNWDENQTNIWFKEKNIDETILKTFKPCNGEILYELYTVLQTVPNFFYESIKSSNVSLRSVIWFSLNLKKLFRDHPN